jgi:hypothetical protein
MDVEVSIESIRAMISYLPGPDNALAIFAGVAKYSFAN